MRMQLRDVSFQYGRETALEGIDLDVSPGAFTVLCGRTGSGKSTLLQLLSGLETPSSGEVIFEGGSCNQVGIVFQIPENQLFAATVREELELGLQMHKVPKRERPSLIKQALNQVGLEPDEFLERSPYLLSGGEKRRVAIAAALVLKPKALVLDEPTAGLDPSASRDLLDILYQLKRDGITIVIATHELDAFFPLADRIVLLKEGRIVYNGIPSQLAEHPFFMEEAGLEFPSIVRISYLLRMRGKDMGAPTTVEEFLASLEKSDESRMGTNEQQVPTGSLAVTTVPATPVGVVQNDSQSLWNPHPRQGKSLLHRLDPRAKWAAMVGLSVACLQLTALWGIATAFLLAIALLMIAQINWRRAGTFLRSLSVMYIFLFLISAISFGNPDLWIGPVGISYQGATNGAIGVARFLLVVLLGLVFTETTSGAPLREGFEWGIRPLRKLGVPTRDLSLAVSVALQFVPWILEKMGQLHKALLAKGNRKPGSRKLSPIYLPKLAVPLLISILRMGDDLATAIDSRGYNRTAERTPWYQLRWTKQDTAALAVVSGVCVLLLWWG
ncbi:ATP-binding cassette domain-containing protein [Effusibacillus lacus]|uniref:ABC transporter domain-containing protein n=1 Tax=Effusibacillus lacus TaxID=1348429 RepID=A0A292YKE3_9BACL|nr:ATP-binding cassette domain-containing protein [Effusibacillus lacus]TCS75490.1 energy-coupling factor transport system ATP-binding protein [Effusibacillus lacus]GAX88955.1 hypothetical protein EFBL_0569 [Effusibacillus lacus]